MCRARYSKHLLPVLTALLATMPVQVARGAAASDEPVEIGADHPNIQYIGRFDFSDPKSPTCAWPGSTIRARYEGRMIAILLNDTPADRTDGLGAPFRNLFEILIDGKLERTVVAQPGDSVYAVGDRLPYGPHTIEIFKRTEALVGYTSFRGFRLPPGGKLLAPPPRPGRRIEFIGDSITAGLDLMKVGKRVFCRAAQNNYLTYAQVTARNLGAEAVCLAYSANGVHCYSNGGKHNTMPTLYSRILPHDPKSRWDFTTWKPHVVVIHLGTNDMAAHAMGVCTDSFDDFVKSYVDFIKQIRTNYGDVPIFCAIGPALWPSELQKKFPKTVVETMKKNGDENVHYILFEDIGDELHPDAANHRKMAEVLTKAIRAEMGTQWNEK